MLTLAALFAAIGATAGIGLTIICAYGDTVTRTQIAGGLLVGLAAGATLGIGSYALASCFSICEHGYIRATDENPYYTGCIPISLAETNLMETGQ